MVVEVKEKAEVGLTKDELLKMLDELEKKNNSRWYQYTK